MQTPVGETEQRIRALDPAKIRKGVALIQGMIDEAVKAEREACADSAYNRAISHVVIAIRARGEAVK